MKLTGTWVGHYVLGPESEAKGSAGAKVPFTMSLTESWRRSVVGYVRDDASRGGQPERGRIRGKRSGRTVEFEKTMPVAYVRDDDGNQIQLRDFLEHTLGASLPVELPPHRIFYSGTLDDLGESITGAWKILPWAETQDGQPLGGGSGTWSARRTSYEPSEV